METLTPPPRQASRSYLRRAAQRLAALTQQFAATTAIEDPRLPPAIACAAFTLRILHRRSATTSAAAVQLAQATSPCDNVLESLVSLADDELAIATRAIADELGDDEVATEHITQFVEHFLAAHDEPARRRHGVYYTPQVVAEYLVARADAAMSQHFPASGGLAGAGEIFDPAVGTGVFPLAAIDRIYTSLAAQWRGEGESDAAIDERWDDYVRTSLLYRLCGCELMPAAQVVAQLLVGERLAAYGFRPLADDRLRIDVADALLPAPSERQQESPVVVLGNPPYRGVSASEHAWIDELLRGRSPDGRSVASYFHIDGQPLGEKKHWLHDDYVKFFRLAQWRIEQAGAGVVALVTNHGFLDNPTFRGMRCGLLKTFNNIEVVDLHGNVKHGAVERDESVFTTQQGMALSLLVATPHQSVEHRVRRADLRGPRAGKLAQLRSTDTGAIDFVEVRPRSPQYFFHAEAAAHNDEYQQFWPIDEVMPVNTTAIVTARDSLVIAFTCEELIERLARFRDVSIPDEQIRRELFPRSRTGKYPPGDTRGWKLRVAREQLAADDRWREKIRTCLYRPFDRRYIYWSPTMIDWPRPEVMRHMEAGDNLAIVCRRQQVRGAPCNFFWIADNLVIDGYIRSDNRGSESIFPLSLVGDNAVGMRSNFAPECLASVERQLGPVTPLQLFQYFYAIFHSSAYRSRYAEPLASGFPRVPLVRSPALFQKLSKLGEALIALHLPGEHALVANSLQLHGTGTNRVDAGYPKFSRDAVAINPQQHFATIAEDAWLFQVGAHQALRKWLKDRRGRVLSPAEITAFRQIACSIAQTVDRMQDIDRAVANHGGWQTFV